ncbi:oxygenase MpaB family protein [Sphingobium bisphenolivorans]|uniref:oxygenase MpaB family protein n=1 Tax=Sphingobium bisphenolivorans TaxID=1335760 RepID=UPI0003B43084|nr:oxygenase MpaB family protein [Sphingobium bisphenolivorans]
MRSAILDIPRSLLVDQVRGVFNDRTKGERPVVPSDNALYPRGAVIRRVHGDVTAMMIGGVSALLLQMLHPAALAGIWEHSRFRDDMLGRLRRTARFIAVTSYADRAEADAAIARVRQVHEQVRGTLSDGTPYAANDPALLAWVHVCEAVSFLDAWIAFAEPAMSRADQDRYFAQAALVARALGADPVPQSRAQAEGLMTRFRPELKADERTREVARMVLDQPAPSLALAPVQKVLMQASVAMLPRWARRMHGLSLLPFSAPVTRAGAFALAHTVRWAFRQEGGVRS